jgi:hypothetical protein
MNTLTYTPGPWHVGKRAGNPAIYSQDGAEIAEVLHVTNDDWQGNARLLAAAPDLLGLAKEARQFEVLTGENLAVFTRTFAALAANYVRKVEGGGE